VRTKTGYSLPEGYAFARAIANLTLRAVDAAVERPFVRWLDDYTVFGDSINELEGVIHRVGSAAEELGLSINATKTSIMASDDVRKHRSGSLVELHPERTAELELTPESPERKLRYILRLGAERRDPLLVRQLVLMADSLPEAAYPRLAAYLASVPDAPMALELCEELLSSDRENQDWATLRLAPVLWYVGSSINQATAEVLLKAAWSCSILIPSISRVLAKGQPEAVELLPTDASPLADRARRLALLEAHRTESDEINFSVGPPVKSYL
jgi:hypothetical protein